MSDPIKILGVDDEPDFELLITQRFRRQIRDREFAFLFAHHGEEALALLDADPAIELMLLDINMPVMDGLQFLETRRQENLAQGVPVVMITTEGNETFVLRAIAAGAQGYICKPFTAEQVKVRVLPLLRAA